MTLREKIAAGIASLALVATGFAAGSASAQDATPDTAREIIETAAELGDLADAWLAQNPTTTTEPPTTTTTVPPVLWPDASTTGYVGAGLALSDLTASGSITTTADGQVIDRVNVTGRITVKHRNVTIRRSRVASSGYQIDNTAATGLIVEDTELIGTSTAAPAALASGKNYTLRRVNVWGSIDGVKATGNVRIEHTWIHDQRRTSTSHNDAIQNSGTSEPGSGVYVWRSSIDGPYRQTNAAVQAATNVGRIDRFQIVESKLSGGNITLRMLDKGTGYGPPTNSGCWGCVFVLGSTSGTIGNGPYDLAQWADLDGDTRLVGCRFSDGTPIPDQ